MQYTLWTYTHYEDYDDVWDEDEDEDEDDLEKVANGANDICGHFQTVRKVSIINTTKEKGIYFNFRRFYEMFGNSCLSGSLAVNITKKQMEAFL